MVPPRGMMFTGSGDFIKQGDTFLKHFIEKGGLKPEDHVLDIGSGIGRMARPLTAFLDPNSRYEGFDVMEEGIRWCKTHISSKFPHFNFTHVPLQNGLYTGQGKDAAQFRFPYEDNQFDFVLLTSVFTHMKPAEVKHYLQEISRVMKPGANGFATFFVVDEQARDHMLRQASNFFPVERDTHYLHNADVAEANIGFKTVFIERALGAAGLVQTGFFPGRWSGREGHDFQDILVFTRKTDPVS